MDYIARRIWFKPERVGKLEVMSGYGNAKQLDARDGDVCYPALVNHGLQMDWSVS